MNKTIIKSHVTSFAVYMKEFMRMSFSEKMLAFLYLFSMMPIVYVILYGVNSRLGLSAVNEFLQAIVFASLAMLSFSQLWKELNRWDVLFVVACAMGYILSPQIYPNTSLYVLLNASKFLLTVLPFYIIGASIDLKKQSNTLLHIGRIGVLVTLFLVVLERMTPLSFNFYEEEEDMGQAYRLLVPLMIVTWNALRKPNVFDMFFSFIGLIMLLGFGTRGPILCLAIFIVLTLYIKSKVLGYKVRVGIILVGCFCLVFIKSIANFFGGIMAMFGMSSRVFADMDNFEEASSSGRDSIWADAFDLIISNGVDGEGLFADRLFIIINGEGTYVHNFFLEVGINFGLYIGLLISLGVLLIFFYDSRKLKGTEYLTLFIAIFCIGFVSLMVSGSYLEYSFFWLLLGVSTRVMRTPRAYYLSKELQVQKRKTRYDVLDRKCDNGIVQGSESPKGNY